MDYHLDDTCGHAAGDTVIRALGRCLARQSSRRRAVAAGWAGTGPPPSPPCRRPPRSLTCSRRPGPTGASGSRTRSVTARSGRGLPVCEPTGPGAHRHRVTGSRVLLPVRGVVVAGQGDAGADVQLPVDAPEVVVDRVRGGVDAPGDLTVSQATGDKAGGGVFHVRQRLLGPVRGGLPLVGGADEGHPAHVVPRGPRTVPGRGRLRRSFGSRLPFVQQGPQVLGRAGPDPGVTVFRRDPCDPVRVAFGTGCGRAVRPTGRRGRRGCPPPASPPS